MCSGVSGSPERGRVLVLDGDMSHALSIVRSLARCGVEVDVGSHVDKPITGCSRHVRQVLPYPNPLTAEADFLDWIRGVASSGRYSLIIPVTERTVVPLHGSGVGAAIDVLALPPQEALAVALDKAHTIDLARSLGIPVPQGVRIEREADLDAALPGLTFPVVIKPSRSIGQNDAARQQLSVEYAFGEKELRDRTRHFLGFGEVLLQGYVRGQGVGIELIADRGRVVFAFQHLRLHEVPLTGGGSSLRMSVPLEPALLAASENLMAALAWHGVAMVEFKWNADDKSFTLMEINGRFWGSLPLAVAAGADFPAMLYELLLQGGVRPRPAARVGVYCRKLSSDIYWHEQVIRRDAPAGLVRFPTYGTMLKQLLLVFSPRHYFDVQQWRDPWPGMVDLGRIGRDYLARVGRWRQGRDELRAHRAPWRDGRVRRRLQQTKQILFVCYGNINRSALAERCFRQLAPGRAIMVISAGFHEEDGRPADPVMVEVAREAKIDLSDWSSHRITAEMVAASDTILVMEHRHYERLTQAYPAAAEKTFLLGMAGAIDGRGEIDDPFGKQRLEYERCAREVIGSVHRLLEILPPSDTSTI